MSSTAKSGGSGTFILAPEGTHIARCYGFVDLGTQQVEFQGESKLQEKCLLSWELPNALIEEEGELKGKPYGVSRRFTTSIHPKSALRPLLESWRGKQFTPEEELGFDLLNVVGVPCMINVGHEERNGKTYANVNSVMALPKGTVCPDQINPTVKFSIPDNVSESGIFESEAFLALSDGLRGVIEKSLEYGAWEVGAGDNGAVSEAPELPGSNEDDPTPF